MPSFLSNFRFNRLINVMIWSDFVIMSAAGVVAPILAVYVTKQIQGGDLASVGYATAMYWVMRSLIQVPIGYLVDKHKDDRLTFNIMVVGYGISALVPLLYYFWAHAIWQVYVLQALDGTALALTLPTWLALFTSHLDHGKEATEWAAYSNATGLGYAVAAALGGTIAETYGFHAIFPMTSLIMLIGLAILVFAWPYRGHWQPPSVHRQPADAATASEV